MPCTGQVFTPELFCRHNRGGNDKVQSGLLSLDTMTRKGIVLGLLFQEGLTVGLNVDYLGPPAGLNPRQASSTPTRTPTHLSETGSLFQFGRQSSHPWTAVTD